MPTHYTGMCWKLDMDPFYGPIKTCRSEEIHVCYHPRGKAKQAIYIANIIINISLFYVK